MNTLLDNLIKETKRPVIQQYCFCCGCLTKGRQWSDMDSGSGICIECIGDVFKNDDNVLLASQEFGIKGIHFMVYGIFYERSNANTIKHYQVCGLDNDYKGEKTSDYDEAMIELKALMGLCSILH